MSTLDINKATKAQLLKYAKEELGLEIPSSMGLQDIRNTISGTVGATEQGAPAGPESEAFDFLAEDNEPPPPLASDPWRRKVNITIMKTEGDTGNADVFVSVNGRDFLIQRDVSVDVPEPVYGALRDAKAVQFIPKVDDRGNQYLERRVVQSYPFTVNKG